MTAPRNGVCRVVTTSLSARLLLAGQMAALDEVTWAVTSGDAWPDAPAGLELHVVPMRREPALSDLRAMVALTRLFGRRRFRLVQTHTPKASLLGLPAARLSGTPAAYTVHGALFYAGNSRRRNVAGWLFEKWCCAWADRVLLQSREDLTALPAAHICADRKLRYIGNGIDLDRFIVLPRPARTRPTVLMVSRLVAEKGCRDFFELARRLSAVADFTHVGPVEHDQRDGLTSREIDRARELGVHVAGAVTDVRPWLASADVVVLPSYREGIPRAAMEAAASGRPVVAYDIRGVREVVPPAAHLLAPLGDLDALERIVRRLVDDRRACEEAGNTCAAHVRAGFSEASVVARLRQVYAEIGVLT
jgi:glycosyltransferase involved in cell wall biosynthesis